MKTNLNPIWFAGLGLGVLLLLAYLKPFAVSQEVSQNEAVEYSMPRPESEWVNDFDLQNREVDRQFIALAARQAQQLAKQNAKAIKPVVFDPKKAKQAALLAKQREAFARSRRTSVNFVGGETQNAPQNDTNDSAVSNPRVNVAAKIPSKGNPIGVNKAAVEDKQKTSAQWRALLFSQPTAKNLDLLVAAYKEGSLDSASFYALVEELLESNRTDLAALGVRALQETPSRNSFRFIVLKSTSFKSQPSRTQLIAEYQTAARIAIMDQTLLDSDAQVVVASLQVVQNSLVAISNPTVGAVNASSIAQQAANYKKIYPILQRILTQQNPAALSLTQNLIALLNSRGFGPSTAAVAQANGN